MRGALAGRGHRQPPRLPRHQPLPDVVAAPAPQPRGRSRGRPGDQPAERRVPATRRRGARVRDHTRDDAIEGEERGMSFWKDRPVLVTGGTGLLGSWLVAALVERGAQTVMLVRDRVPDALVFTSGAAERCTIVPGDVTDGHTLERTLAEYEIDAVFHLAARTIVGQAYVDPIGTFRSNMQGTWEVLDACRRNGLRAPDRGGLVRQGLRQPAQAALRGGPAAGRPPPLRRLEELHRPDRAVLRLDLRPAGGGHALRQPVRGRRPQLQPPRSPARSAGR